MRNMTPAQRHAQYLEGIRIGLLTRPPLDEPHEPLAPLGSPDMKPTTPEEWAEIVRKATDLENPS